MSEYKQEDIYEAICNKVCKCCSHYNDGKFSQFCDICKVSEVLGVVNSLDSEEDK